MTQTIKCIEDVVEEPTDDTYDVNKEDNQETSYDTNYDSGYKSTNVSNVADDEVCIFGFKNNYNLNIIEFSVHFKQSER